MTSESSDQRTNNYTVQSDGDRHLVVSPRGAVRCVLATREAAESAARRFSIQDRCETSDY